MTFHARLLLAKTSRHCSYASALGVLTLMLLATMSAHPNVIAADPPGGTFIAESNVLLNGDFHEWKDYKGGITTESVGTPPNSLPLHWYGGPGVGAIATYDRFQASVVDKEQGVAVPRFFRVAWSKPQSKDWLGEAHHQPAFRFTFLECFEIGDVRKFAGKNVRVTFFGRSPAGKVEIVPILWHSYDSQTPGIRGVIGKGYQLFESSGKWNEVAIAHGKPNPAAACALDSKWQRFEKVIALPGVAGRSITPGHYTGVGFDLAGRSAPTIDIADVEVCELRPEKAGQN